MLRASVIVFALLLPASLASAQDAAGAAQNPNPPAVQAPAPEITAISPQVIAPAPPPSPTASAAELEQEGDRLRANKMFVDATEYYEAALKKTPLKDQDKAAEATQRAGASVLYNKIGIAYLQQGRFKEARKSFERSIKLNKTLPDAYNNLGAALYMEAAQRKSKSFGKAIKNYRKAIELNDELASAHFNMATAYFSQKEYEKAMPEFQRAIQLDPGILERNSRTGVSVRMSSPQDQAAYQFMIARLYAQMKDLDRSLLYLQKAVEQGYAKIKDVYKDEAFSELRKDPRFEVLMARATAETKEN